VGRDGRHNGISGGLRGGKRIESTAAFVCCGGGFLNECSAQGQPPTTNYCFGVGVGLKTGERVFVFTSLDCSFLKFITEIEYCATAAQRFFLI